jgi:hypothetical protein
MNVRKYLAVLIMVLLLIQSACNDDRNNQANIGEVDIDMQNINLHALNEEVGKKNIDVVLEKIKEYTIDCKISDFTLREEYASFVVTETNKSNEDDHQSITVYCRLQTNKEEDAYDAKVRITFYKSQPDNQDMMRGFLNACAAPEVFPSLLDVGDFAIGDIFSIDFIRGNIFVSVTGYDEAEVGDLAKEIDQQILEIINVE